MKRFFCSMALLLIAAVFLSSCGKAGSENEYFPLQVGNSWHYEVWKGDAPTTVKLELKVQKMEKVGDKECFVLESYVNDNKETLQREFYAKTKEGLAVIKRVMGEREIAIEPPELMIKTPLAAGQKWDWSGKLMETQLTMNFTTEDGGKLKIKDKEVDTLKIMMTQKVQTGESSSNCRWFAKGIGPVKEEITMSRGAKSLTLNTRLTDYELNKDSKK
jgi:hypothetical protein